jgi:hypothetical protein
MVGMIASAVCIFTETRGGRRLEKSPLLSFMRAVGFIFNNAIRY